MKVNLKVVNTVDDKCHTCRLLDVRGIKPFGF